MAHALEMFFDDAADGTVREHWDRLERVGIASLAGATHRRHRPHVTLAVGDEIAVGEPAVRALKELLGAVLGFPVLGSFPGEAAVLMLGATATAPLLDAHAEVHAAIAERSKELLELYKPGLWVPHCTLAMSLGAGELARAYAQLHPYAGLRARITRVGLVDIETGDIDVLVGDSVG